jgi:uncharacterized protein (DUF1499 family)
LDFVDFPSLARPGSPNTHLVAPAGLCLEAESDDTAPEFEMSAKELFAIVRRIVRSDSSFRKIEEDAEGLRLHFVAVTPILRFKDDVDIAVLSTNADGKAKAPGSTLAVYSRSRLGHSDLGANARRVSKLLKSFVHAAQAP